MPDTDTAQQHDPEMSPASTHTGALGAAVGTSGDDAMARLKELAEEKPALDDAKDDPEIANVARQINEQKAAAQADKEAAIEREARDAEAMSGKPPSHPFPENGAGAPIVGDGDDSFATEFEEASAGPDSVKQYAGAQLGSTSTGVTGDGGGIPPIVGKQVSGTYSQVLTIGRMMRYAVNEAQANIINQQRQHADAHCEVHKAAANGSVTHIGNPVSVGQVFPMIVVAVWGGTCVNGQVFLDGNDTLWVRSAMEDTSDGDETDAGHKPGTYRWPQRS